MGTASSLRSIETKERQRERFWVAFGAIKVNAALTVSFWGVRGSTPCPCETNRRYGGNTACVSLETPGMDPIVFDLGTGLRFFGATQPMDGTFRATAFVTHLHWDHVQGLPFLAALHAAGARMDIHAPSQDGVGVAEAFAEFMRPPYFPVRTSDLAGDIRFHDASCTDLQVGPARVKVRDVPHVGATNGYRVEVGDVAVAYLSDHQQPIDDPLQIAPSVLELCQDADLVIHDAQYTALDFEQKADWGHCTVQYAVEVAARAGAKRLVLFHHDPARTDEDMDVLLAEAVRLGRERGLLEVLAAYEGLSIVLGPHASSADSPPATLRRNENGPAAAGAVRNGADQAGSQGSVQSGAQSGIGAL